MQKTSKPVTIPINEKLEKLFLKYQTPSGEYFPGIYEQDVNDVIMMSKKHREINMNYNRNAPFNDLPALPPDESLFETRNLH